jgi:carboxyl-terminal processing protease
MHLRFLKYLSVGLSILALCALIPLNIPSEQVSTPDSEASLEIQDLEEGQLQDKNSILIHAIFSTLTQNHFNPPAIDDTFSANAYKKYLSSLDYSNRFLLKSDVEKLNKYEEKIDDQISKGRYKLFTASYEIIQSRIKESESFYQKILSKPFDFEKEETLELDGEKLEFATNQKELSENWRKYLKYQTLLKLQDLKERQDKLLEDKDTVIEEKSFAVLEEEARNKVKESQEKMVQENG